MEPTRNVALGLPSFAFADLFDPQGLARLLATFVDEMRAREPELARTYENARAGEPRPALELSALLIAVADRLEPFLLRLFAIEGEYAALMADHRGEDALGAFRREFVGKRVRRRKQPAAVPMPAPLRERLTLAFGGEGDEELRAARTAMAVLGLWQVVDARPAAPAEAVEAARRRLGAALDEEVPAESIKERVWTLLDGLEAWHAGRLATTDWTSYQQRAPIEPTHEQLVRLSAADEGAPLRGPLEEQRARQGFALTDARMGRREVHRETQDCLICHPRQKDSCRTGLKGPDGGVRRTPLGTPLGGCPLDERISEAHQLFNDGHLLAALAMITRDNPMCPGTGHRICNDCMKACVFQKQQPINVPEAETHILTEVLKLPYGFELWSLLTRFNPLRLERPVPEPYHGHHALVVGLGPAGYTLAHYLLGEGFGVVAVEGLKLEPLPDAWTGRDAWPPQPMRDASALFEPLDRRVAGGFGGVAEYGITVRWDKNFLRLISLSLQRWRTFRAFGGVRFGGTFALPDAWQAGFDHVALAAGAGRPTLVPVKNNLMRGMRSASDFLMGLQQTGAFRAESLANLQVELPAVVVGGGLTAIDTATELAAYYPVQVEKLARRVATLGEEAVRATLDAEEADILSRMLAHARELMEARARGPVDVPALVHKWGGVTVAYRKGLSASPAYRLNHEEVQKALEEGISFCPNVSPVEAMPDAFGHVDGLRVRDPEGHERVLPARSVITAAGTAPNVTYAREYPDSLPLDGAGRFLQTHVLKGEADGSVSLVPAAGHQPGAVFAGALAPPRAAGTPERTVSVLGDNHPHFLGNVVKAMASAKHAYRHIAAPFAASIARAPVLSDAAGAFDRFCAPLADDWQATVLRVERLTPTIVEVVVRAPAAARKFQPGQFFRLQNFDRDSMRLGDVALSMEGLALTGAWVNAEEGTLGMVALEMGVSSRLCGQLRPGQPVVVMGPTGTATEIGAGENVLLCGGGLGNAVLFSVAQALQARGNRVLYFAGYRRQEDIYKQDEVEAASDMVVWSVDQGPTPEPRRPQDRAFSGNIVQALEAYAAGQLGQGPIPLGRIDRILTIGSDRMMAAVARARHGSLKPFLHPEHEALASINSPMQCMLKEICAQCLQRHVDPHTGEESYVFSCFNQDQKQDTMDWKNLAARLRQNTLMEKVSGLYLDHLWQDARPA